MRLTWFNRHRRYRDDLSAYIDGELPPERTANSEAHLEVCQGCRRELEGLRATALALRDLPPAAVPRSFALTPEQAGRPAGRRPASGVPAITAGLRLASAGLAVALAVVVVVDLSSSGDSGGERAAGPAALQPRMEAKSADTSADRALGPMEAGGAESGGQGAPGGTGMPYQGATPTPGGQMAVIGAPATAPAPPADAGQDVTNGSAAESPSALSYQPPAAQSGGGTDVLRVIEIGMAVTVALAVAGSILLARAARAEGRRDLP